MTVFNKEPTNINFQLRDIYDKKCELLAKKHTLEEQQIAYPAKLYDHHRESIENNNSHRMTDEMREYIGKRDREMDLELEDN